MADIKVEDPGQDVNITATDGGDNSSHADQAEDVWDEERLHGALYTLKEMYIQLRELRSSIPRLVAPLTVKQPSPEVLFQKFTAATTSANDELKQFRQIVEDDKTKKILEHARKSRTENPKGIKPWIITEHPEWLTRKG